LLHSSGRHHSATFDNTNKGFKNLVGWLRKLEAKDVLACMEATGRYGEALAKWLHERNFKVVVANPAFVSKHKESLNQHNKTDPTDSEAIADYARCFASRLRLWQPLSALQERLRDVQGQIAKLRKARTMFTNRGKCGLKCDEVVASNEAVIAVLDEQIEEMEASRERLFEQLPALQEIRRIFDEVPGVGIEIASGIAAKINLQDFCNGRQLAIFLGCSSSEWQSGKLKRRGKQRKTGDSDLRWLVRQGAVAALRCSFYKEFVQRLRKKGLKESQIITALARKILIIGHALWRRKEAFDRFYQHPLSSQKVS
jgi:transposase